MRIAVYLLIGILIACGVVAAVTIYAGCPDPRQDQRRYDSNGCNDRCASQNKTAAYSTRLDDGTSTCVCIDPPEAGQRKMWER